MPTYIGLPGTGCREAWHKSAQETTPFIDTSYCTSTTLISSTRLLQTMDWELPSGKQVSAGNGVMLADGESVGGPT
jgi:hypothetical protein